MCVCGHLGDEVSASRLEGQGISRTVNNIELILRGVGRKIQEGTELGSVRSYSPGKYFSRAYRFYYPGF